jgi:putative transposase
LLGDVAEVAEEIIRETCKELDIEIIDMAMNVDHVHLFTRKHPSGANQLLAMAKTWVVPIR